MIVRAAVAAVAALLLAVQVLRTAAVDALADARPADAAKAWAGHPAVQVSLGLTAIGQAAHAGHAVDPSILDRIYRASAKAPLSPDPFLVRGVQAQLSGDTALAESAFLAAERRRPRSLPARYFLADLYLRQGDAARGLPQVAVLARLVPEGPARLAPYVAAYARDPNNRPQLRALFRDNPLLEDEALVVLAGDARNAEAVLALATPARRSGQSPWLAPLLTSLAQAGDYRGARQIWAAIAHVPLSPGSLIHDRSFRDSSAPPPFNWALTSSTVGLAERQKGGGLHVIYYGQEDGPLASQLLVLPPGRYRLATDAPGLSESAGSLSWSIVCAKNNRPIASIPLRQATAQGWRFEVPASCPGQRLELTGSASDIPRTVDATIRSVRLLPGGRNG